MLSIPLNTSFASFTESVTWRGLLQDQTLTNELSYFDEFNLLSSTVITIHNKTLRERLETSLARDSIISNDSDDDKSDTEVVNQDNPVIVNNKEMAVVIPDSQQVSLCDALEVVSLFDGCNVAFGDMAIC